MSRGKAITTITLRQILYLELLGDTCEMIALKLGFHPDTIRKVKTRASYKELKGHLATKLLQISGSGSEIMRIINPTTEIN